jgi:hypothetical protein
MSQQVAQGDRLLRGAKLRRAGRVEPLEYLRRAERGVDVRHRLLELELALLDELHRRDRRDRLGHRGDAEHGIERHVRALPELANTEGILVEEPLVGGDHRDDAGHFLRIDRLLEHRVDLRA